MQWLTRIGGKAEPGPALVPVECRIGRADRVAERQQGMSPREAIYQAALLRFRPILMTTLAALFGAVPLAIGIGAGAELRQPLGIAIVGGLILSQILTLYTTPVVFVMMDKLRKKPAAAPQACLQSAR